MLGIGKQFPEFSLTGVVTSDIKDAFQPIQSSDFQGKWKVVFFWPKDFTFVCPTEIAAFGALNREFEDRDAKVFGVSTDSEFVHLAWRKDKEELNDLPFPMLADIRRELTSELGILDFAVVGLEREAGQAFKAIVGRAQYGHGHSSNQSVCRAPGVAASAPDGSPATRPGWQRRL